MSTRLPEIIGELFCGISGNDCLCHYLSDNFGELFFGHFRQFEFLLPVSNFFYLKLPLNSKIIWGAISVMLAAVSAPPCLPLSSFVLFVALHECIMKAQ